MGGRASGRGGGGGGVFDVVINRRICLFGRRGRGVVWWERASSARCLAAMRRDSPSGWV